MLVLKSKKGKKQRELCHVGWAKVKLKVSFGRVLGNAEKEREVCGLWSALAHLILTLNYFFE